MCRSCSHSLLILAFQNRFTDLDRFAVLLYAVTVVLCAGPVIFLIAPLTVVAGIAVIMLVTWYVLPVRRARREQKPDPTEASEG